MSTLENESLVPLADAGAVGLGIGRRSLGRRVKNPPPGFPGSSDSTGAFTSAASSLRRTRRS
jgi:hypothetical protein